MEDGLSNLEELKEKRDPILAQKDSAVSTVFLLILMAILPMVLIFLCLRISIMIIVGISEPYTLLLPNAGDINYLVTVIWMLIAVGLMPLLGLIIPAVSAFLFNLAKPLMINWRRAAFSSAVFLLIFLSSFLVLVLLTNLSEFMAYVSNSFGLIIGMGALIGVGMSMSLGLCGRLGAMVRTKRKLG